MSTDNRAPEVKRVSWSRRQQGFTVIRWVIALVLIAVGIGSLGSWAGSSQNCASCHSSIRAVQGAHEETECVSCHVPRGVSGFARFGSSWLRMAAAGYVMGEDPVYPEVSALALDESSCVRCHSALLRPEAAVIGGVRVDHWHLVENGVRCERCHDGYGHRGATQAAVRHVMSECMRCHGESDAETDCSMCHLGNPSDVVSDRRLVQRTWVTGDGTCEGCHRPELARECVACHGGYVMPHPEGWGFGFGHIYDGLVDQQACFECHAPPDGSPPAPHGAIGLAYAGSFCNRCHSYPTPHPPASQWIRQHGPASRGTSVPRHPVCEPCHEISREFVSNCEGCHHTRAACDFCHAERDRRRGR